jgi:glycosyltransferase involved in cell wall biosynthesis
MDDGINVISDISVCWKLIKIIRGNKFDLIHAHSSKPGFFARLASVGTRIPTIYEPASFAFHENSPRFQALFYAVLERFAAKYLTDRIVLVCNGERRLARQYSVGTDKQFITIYTGIDIVEFSPLIDRSIVRKDLGIDLGVKLIGTVARLSEQKAPSDFIHAAALVHESEPDIHFLWAGDGPLESESRELVRMLGLQDHFHFAGFRSDIPNVLSSFDCFVLSSHWEGFSLAVLEAMATGLPIVATRVTGADEAIVDGQNGFLVEIGDISGIAEAIKKIVGDNQLALDMGALSRKYAEDKFPFARMISELDKLYMELVDCK